MISRSNEQLQQQLEYTLRKPDCHSWWISKMQSGCEDTLEEWYVIKFCFKLGKKATEMYGMLQTAFGASCMNRGSVFEWHKRFKEVRESVWDDEMCERCPYSPDLAQGKTWRLSLWDNWGDERGCDEGHWHAHTRGLPWGLPEVVKTVQQVHWGDYFEGD